MKGYRTCVACGHNTRSLLGLPACEACNTPFPPKVVKVLDESVLTLDDPYTRQCSDVACGALTRGNRCVDCRVCGKPLLRKEKKIQPIVVKPRKVYSPEEIEEAKAKKQCDCGAWTVGYRTKVCVSCGQNFPPRADRVKVEKPIEVKAEVVEQPKLNPYPNHEFPKRYDIPPDITDPQKLNTWALDIPCPIPFIERFNLETEFDEYLSDVEDWAHDVRQYILHRRKIYLNNAGLFYYIREQLKGKYSKDSVEMEFIKLKLTELPDVKVFKPRTAIAVA